MEEHFYFIQPAAAQGYICPMKLTFKEALTAQRTPRGLSLEKVAELADVSKHILKNANQNKSETPNAIAVMKVAEVFGVSVEEFYLGVVRQEHDAAAVQDLSKLTAIARRLKDPLNLARLEAYAQSLAHGEEAPPRSE